MPINSGMDKLWHSHTMEGSDNKPIIMAFRNMGNRNIAQTYGCVTEVIQEYIMMIPLV